MEDMIKGMHSILLSPPRIAAQTSVYRCCSRAALGCDKLSSG